MPDENEPIEPTEPNEPSEPSGPNDPSAGSTPAYAANEKIAKINVADEIKNSFLDYSMSVIISRALPDVRDGLKPSQRRILFAMNELGVMPNRKHIKCAKIVGETMGNYHPHGDQAIYPTLVHMAQRREDRSRSWIFWPGQPSAETLVPLPRRTGSRLRPCNRQSCTEAVRG